MNKDETLALYEQGKDAWNAWAKEMLKRRAEMETAGTWDDRSWDDRSAPNRLMKKSPPIGHLGNNRVNITGNLS
jgi:hypothetical protein